MESLTDTVSKIAGRPATTAQMPEHHSMETPQAQHRPKPLDAPARTQPRYQQPEGLFAAPHVRHFGEDITKSAPHRTEQPQAHQPDARYLAPELVASYPHNVPQQCRYPPMPSAFSQQPNDGVVDHAGLLAASPPVERQGRYNPNVGVDGSCENPQYPAGGAAWSTRLSVK